MSEIILHISDLHVSLHEKVGGKINENSYLTTDPSQKDNALFYIERFTNKVKEEYSSSNIFLLITGDITNEGDRNEFEYAEIFVRKIINDLNINNSNILLIPGDHDLNRRHIENLLEEDKNASEEKINEIKYKNFSEFYSRILGLSFDANKIIFNHINVLERFILLGINSCLKKDLIKMNTLGHINIQEFKSELTQLNLADTPKIACFHHNFMSTYDDTHDGQWDKENRPHLIAGLQEQNIHYVFTGNEHTNNTKQTDLAGITSSDCGTLSNKKYDSAFKIYPIIINEGIILENKIYSLHNSGDRDNPFVWDIRTNKGFNQLEKFIIYEPIPDSLSKGVSDILPEQILKKTKDDSIKSQSSEHLLFDDYYYSEEYSKGLYDIVKRLKLFHSGHFHWSETSRAHNWIDTSKLIEDKDNLLFLKNAIIDVIEKKILIDKIDLIIGLGYEGNVLATKSTFKFNKPYSFLPYSYRYEEHEDYETQLKYENSDKVYKNILIITDVVNNGRTIRKLIKKRQKDFFQNVENVFVISLFYTGEHKINSDILNYDFIKGIENYDLENDEEVNNIKFYSIKNMKVESCPYGKNFREECLIYKDKLSCIHLFYNEDKYLKK